MNKQILAQVSQLIAGFGDRFKDVTGAKGSFMLALASLEGIDDAIVTQAIANFICGKVPNHNDDYPLNPAQLCNEVKRLEAIRVAGTFTVIERGTTEAKALERFTGEPIKAFRYTDKITVEKAELTKALLAFPAPDKKLRIEN